MTTADHAAVVTVGFAAWLSSDAFKGVALSEEVIGRTRRAFVVFPVETDAEVYVAELGRKVVGWGARDRAPDYISDLWVDPGCQGKGIGRSVIEHLCEHIRADGHASVRIDTQGRNTGGIRLYERCGFVITWRGIEYSQSMGIELEKVHLEKSLR